MTIEGFEIENWSCIKKLSVSDLPPSGVIVLHGPNRTGKSSIVQALRACLMDYPSTSTALKANYPRGTGEKPSVGVTFTAGGTTYRIAKGFGSSKSELATRTPTGAWRVEANAASEAHARACELVGGNDSAKGLGQLLWLTQAEFRLPDAKKFDPDVQAQLRGILGVLQTALDDRFIERVKNRWNVWHAGQRKAGKLHPLKEGCRLASNQARLGEAKKDFDESELEFAEIERLLKQTSDLEARRFDLDRQLAGQRAELRECQELRERSQTRIAARKLAVERHSRAAEEQEAALGEARQRAASVERLAEAVSTIGPAKQKVDSLTQIVQSMVATLSRQKADLGERKERRRMSQQRSLLISERLRALGNADRLDAARRDLQRAQDVESGIAAIRRHLSENPVPDGATLAALKATHERTLQLQADQDAASMTLTVASLDGSVPAQVSLDGEAPRPQVAANTYSVRRKADLYIPHWGRVGLTRGAGGDDLDQIEADLRSAHQELAEALAAIGIDPNGPDSFDRLLQRNAEYGLKVAELREREGELKKVAPRGLEPLRRKVVEMEAKSRDVASIHPDEADPLPGDRDELERLMSDLDLTITALNGECDLLEGEIEATDSGLGQARTKVTKAMETLAGGVALANGRREELGRLRADEEIERRMEGAKAGLAAAAEELRASELTVEESTVDERIAACKEAVNALERQARDNEEKYHRIKGRLEGSEGLHAQRALASARVDELTRLTTRESLERDAVDRLYELFEECREKQLGSLMGPIRDRVLNWMRVLDIGDYEEIRFGDAFLPDKLVRRDGTAEFAMAEESTGAQELIGMLVRLALGSLLTRAGEPAIAILDDPLTHCDVGRLNKMRVILRRMAEGDAKLAPPAGPLQIIILTCHPEWFRDERARVIDLEDPDVMQRFAV